MAELAPPETLTERPPGEAGSSNDRSSNDGSSNDRGTHVSIEHISVWYESADHRIRPNVAIRELSLEIEAGQFVVIVGPSECGESTLLSIMAGLMTTYSGKVIVGGAPVTGPSLSTGVVFQAPALLPWRSALDNVAYGLEASGVGKVEARRRATDALSIVGLSDRANAHPGKLSGGMQQPVNLPRALASRPSLLLLDEPFAALDAQTREEMQIEVLRIWAELGCTAVFVTHQIDEAVLLADRICILGSGPGSKMIEVVDVDLPRPRGDEMRSDPEFQRLTGHLRGVIRNTMDRGRRRQRA